MDRVPSAPDTLLTLEEASSWAGWDPEVIVQAVATGELLHEAARVRGRDEVRIRFVDLEALVALREGTEVTSAAGSDGGGDPAPVDARDGGDPGTGVEEGSVLRGEEEARADGGASPSAEQPTGEVVGLELRQRLDALMARLEESEQERRAQSAALLLTNRRLLELAAPREAGGTGPPSRWASVAAVAAVGLVALITVQSQASTLNERVDRLSAGHEAELEALTAELDLERDRRATDLAELERRSSSELERVGDLARVEVQDLRVEHARERQALLEQHLEERSAWQDRFEAQEAQRREDARAQEAAQSQRLEGLRVRLEGRLDASDERASAAEEDLGAVRTELALQLERGQAREEANARLRGDLEATRTRLEEIEAAEALLRGEVAQGAQRQLLLEARGDQLARRLASAHALEGLGLRGEPWGVVLARELAVRFLRMR